MSDVAILFNPSAGRGRASRELFRLERLLKRPEFRLEDVAYTLLQSDDEEHLKQLASEKAEEFPVIVGAGGDGTLNTIVNELLKKGKNNIFGMIPLGSSNDIARGFGIDNLEQACLAVNIAVKHKGENTRRADVGVVIADGNAPQYFLGTASLGLGVRVNRYVEEVAKRYPASKGMQKILGLLGIYHSISSGKVPIPLNLMHGNSSLLEDFFLIVFNNTRFYASGRVPNPNATPYDGILNCYCALGEQLFDISEPSYQLSREEIFYLTANKIQSTLRFLQQKPEDIKRIVAPEFKIISGEGAEIQADGKILGPYRDITVSVKPKALSIIVNP